MADPQVFKKGEREGGGGGESQHGPPSCSKNEDPMVKADRDGDFWPIFVQYA